MATAEAKTVKVVVVSDGITYRVPGQEERLPVAFGHQLTFVTAAAHRGDEIDLDAADADRFFALGAVAKPGSREAGAAQSNELRVGVPYGAVKISGENDNTPVDKLRHLAVEHGVARAKDFGWDDADRASLDGGDDGAPVTGAAPPDDELTWTEKGLGGLNAAQLKNLAARHGVRVESKATKKSIIADTLAARESANKS